MLIRKVSDKAQALLVVRPDRLKETQNIVRPEKLKETQNIVRPDRLKETQNIVRPDRLEDTQSTLTNRDRGWKIHKAR